MANGTQFPERTELPPELKGTLDLDLLTPDFLKTRYLVGLNLKDPDGNDFPDEFYEWKIETAKDRFEKYTNIFLTPRQVLKEEHDYEADQWVKWAWFTLRNFPVQRVDELLAEYPTGQTITVFPSEWIRLRQEHGQVQLVPTTGTLSNILIGRGGTYLGLLRFKINQLPHLFKVTYTAGLEHGCIPHSIIDVLAKLAVIDVLADISDSVYGPGIQSLSVGLDGLSQSIGVSNTQEGGVFVARVNKYLKDLFGRPDLGDRGTMNNLRDIFRGPLLVVA